MFTPAQAFVEEQKNSIFRMITENGIVSLTVVGIQEKIISRKVADITGRNIQNGIADVDQNIQGFGELRIPVHEFHIFTEVIKADDTLEDRFEHSGIGIEVTADYSGTPLFMRHVLFLNQFPAERCQCDHRQFKMLARKGESDDCNCQQ